MQRCSDMKLNFENPFFSVLSLVGSICLIISFIFKYFPPKKINYLYGYRSARSMKSQELWDFAQRHSPMQMIYASVSMLALSVLGLFIESQKIIWMWIALALMCFLFLYFCSRTECELKNLENKKS